MGDQQQEQKAYELRLAIEAQLYELLEVGFDVDEIEEFVQGVVSDIREEQVGE